MSEEKMRAKFEAWQVSGGFKRPNDPGEWEAWQAAWQAALQESEAMAVYQFRCEEVNWIDCTEKFYTDWKGEKRILYTTPQYAQAIETAAYMWAADYVQYALEVHNQEQQDLFIYAANKLRALIPQDGRTKLEEFGMKVAVSVAHLALSKAFIRTLDSWGRNKPQIEDDLRAIVTNLIGEKK